MDVKISNKTLLMHMLEKATGKPGDMPIQGEMRVLRRLTALVVRLNEARGRQIRDLTMNPAPDFEGADAAYQSLVSGGQVYVFVTIIGLESKLAIEPHRLPPDVDVNSVKLANAHSYERGALWAPGHSEWSASAPLLKELYMESQVKHLLAKYVRATTFYSILDGAGASGCAEKFPEDLGEARGTKRMTPASGSCPPVLPVTATSPAARHVRLAFKQQRVDVEAAPVLVCDAVKVEDDGAGGVEEKLQKGVGVVATPISAACGNGVINEAFLDIGDAPDA